MQKTTLQSQRQTRPSVGLGVALALVTFACASHRPGSDEHEPFTCVNKCLPDPGSRPMTQKMCDDAEAGLEFLPLPIWDMGPQQDSAGNGRNVAVGWYSYDDNTTPFRVPGKSYEPTTDRVERCGEGSPNEYYALHLYGGPFQEWGGGFGRTMKCMNTDSTGTSEGTQHPWLSELNLNKYLCGAKKTTSFRIDAPSLAACASALTKPEDRTELEKTLIGVCPQRDLNYARDGKVEGDETDEPYMTGMALDVTDHVMHDPSGADIPVRGWDGIAFWARRSPNSQPGMRIAIADKYTDDDMMYLSEKYSEAKMISGALTQPLPRYCERNVQCGCTNSKPCTPVNVKYVKFDVDGNRLKYAVDTSNRRDACARKVAVDENGRSLINESGEVVKDANGVARTWPDGSAITPYVNCQATDIDANGQPIYGQTWQTDVFDDVSMGFCFDPAVDPIPPPGTRADIVNHRIFQEFDPTVPSFQTAAGAPVNNYALCGQEIFTSAYPQDSWIRFFCNTYEVPGYNYPVCGDTVCNIEFPSFQAPDPKSHGRTCNPFSFVGGITRSFCYTPGVDPNPYEGTQTCGDFWMKPVNIGVDWTFIKVPFDSMLQQGWAKRQYQIDLSSITNVRFQWERGWMDYQISDVRFYRTKQ